MTHADKLERFSIPEPNSGCLLWTGGVTPKGYGIVNIQGVAYLVHRVAWQEQNGEIPKGLLVCHKCDVPSCINPEHMFLVTPSDNSADMVKKGRTRIGSAHREAKLTEKQAAMILGATETHAVLARRYGVSENAIASIKQRKTWRHVSPLCSQY